MNITQQRGGTRRAGPRCGVERGFFRRHDGFRLVFAPYVWWRAALLLLLVLVPRQALAEDEVIVVEPDQPTELLSEALVRLTAELRAFGFQVERRSQTEQDETPEASYVGLIALSQEGQLIELETHTLFREGILIQRVDASHPQTTAEVVAIRAVESLRAALLQGLRARSPEPELSPALQRFTGYDEPVPRLPEKAQQQPTPPPPPERTPPRTAPPPALGLRGHLSLSPSIAMLGEWDAWAGAIEGRGLVHYRSASLGLIVEGTPLRSNKQVTDGTLRASYLTFLLRAGWVKAFGRRAELHLGVAGGYYQLRLRTEAGPGVEGGSVNHHALLLQGDLAVNGFFENGLGLQWFVRAGSLVRSVGVFSEDASSGAISEEASYGRPVLNTGLGISYRFPKPPR